MSKKDKPPFEREIFADENYVRYHLSHFIGNEPHVFNGRVSFRRWKCTAELIEEPQEVLAQRLQDLWDHSGNIHHWEPLKDAAKSIGYELQGSPGSKRKR